MFEDVVIDEVNELLGKGYDDNMPIMKAIGVREISRLLKKEIDTEECKNAIKKKHTKLHQKADNLDKR